MACSSRACGADESFATFDVLTRADEDEESSSSLHLMHLLPVVCVCVCVFVQGVHLFLESNLESWAQLDI